MSDSTPLPTTPGNFDHPPASTSSDLRHRPTSEPRDVAALARFSSIQNRLHQATIRQENTINQARAALDRARDSTDLESLLQVRAAADALRRDHELRNVTRLQSEMPPPTTIESRRRMREMLHELGVREWRADEHVSPERMTPDQLASPEPPRPLLGDGMPDFRADQRAGRLSHSVGSTTNGHTSAIQDVDERLAQINEDVRSLLDRPISEITSGDMTRMHPDDNDNDDDDDDDDRLRLRKRRCLDSWGNLNTQPRIAYGWKGQAVPGRLKMELLSSDGGTYELAARERLEYWRYNNMNAENVLKDDRNAVYCTRSPRCNLVLQHQGQTTFSLDRIVIRAPKSGYTDPVQEGLVFISLDRDDLFHRTTQYQVYHYPTSRFGPRTARSPSNNVHDFATNTNIRTHPLEQHPAIVTDPDCETQFDSEVELDIGPRFPRPSDHQAYLQARQAHTQAAGNDDDEDELQAVENTENTAARQHHLSTSIDPFEPRTSGTSLESYNDYDNDDRDDDDLAQDVLAQFDFDQVLRRDDQTGADRRERAQAEDRLMPRRRRVPVRSTNITTNRAIPPIGHDDSRLNAQVQANLNASASDASLLTPAAHFSMRPHCLHMHNVQHHYYVNSLPHISPLAPLTAPPASLLPATDELNISPQGPHRSSFSCARDNMIMIKFDPPISGRFLLLKLWNPKHKGNIDIESVQVFGCSGVRWFPDSELR